MTTARFPETCVAMQVWSSRVEQEYPGEDFYRGAVPNRYSKILNLFADDHFSRFFGAPFDWLSEAERARIGTQVMRQCLTNGQWRRAFTWQGGLDDPFLPRSVRTSEVMAAVIERRRLRLELGRTVSQLNALPPDASSWREARRLETSLLSFQVLWPSEFRAADDALNQAKSRVAGPELIERVSAILASTGSIADARRLTVALGAIQSAGPARPAGDDDIAAVVSFAPADVREQQSGRLQARLSGLIDAEVRRDRDALGRLGGGTQGLEAGGRWLASVNQRYGDVANAAPVRTLVDDFAKLRAPLLRGAEAALRQQLEAARTTAELRAVVGAYLSVPSDRSDPAGGPLLALAQQKVVQLQRAEAVSAAQVADAQRAAASPCAGADTARRGNEPTEREMCLAVETVFQSAQAQTGKLADACADVGRGTDPVANVMCLAGTLAGVGGGPQLSLRAFQKIECSPATSAGRPGYFCDYAVRIVTDNALTGPVFNRVPGEIQTARFVQSAGSWLVLPRD